MRFCQNFSDWENEEDFQKEVPDGVDPSSLRSYPECEEGKELTNDKVLVFKIFKVRINNQIKQ